MAYTQIYEASQLESLFPNISSSHHIPSTDLMDPNHDYSPVEGAAMASSFEMYDDRPGYQVTGTNNAEEGGDPASRPRLTQEQLAHLERQFALHHKPNTEYKRSLAENMGVDYSKVNNWFQNRRAKAKHENQVQLRSDPLFEDTLNFLPEDFPPMDYRRSSGRQPSVYYSSPEQCPAPSEDFASCLDFSSLNDPRPNYSTHSTPLITDMGAIRRYDDEKQFHSSFIPTDSLASWPANNVYSDAKMSTPSIVDLGSLGTHPESPLVQSYGLDLTQGNAIHHGQQMYHNSFDGHLVGNPSSNSFVTSPSEEDDHARLITPPQEASPLSGLNQVTFQHDRRTSNDSDLAENFDTIHLQQSQAGLGLYGSSTTASASDLVSPTGLLTPVITPDITDSKLPLAIGHDLASRRNRRPPKLQSDSGRSFSYAGPGTSPHLRISPAGSGKVSPVRRIRSTGNNLNVVTGRVKKQGTSSAQLSPRNFEACFQIAAMSDVQPNADTPAHRHQMSDSVPSSLKSSPPVSFRQQNPATWIDSPSQFPIAPSPWNRGITGDSAFVHGPGYGHALTSPQNEHTNMFAPAAFQQVSSHSQQYGYHCPPQSAPSHITTFETASSTPPTMRSWQPPLVASEPYHDDAQFPVPIRPYYPHHHSHSGPLGQFAPSPDQFQGYHSGFAPFQPFQQYLNRTPTPALKPLDIKVETGPSPPKELAQASQERKEYTFQNSFSNDPDFATNTKK